jgi:hypothetical protein
MADVDALRLAGGARSVDYVASVVRAGELVRLVCRGVLLLVRLDRGLEDELGGAGDPVLVLLHHEAQARLGVGEDVRERLVRDGDSVDGDILAAGLQDREDGDDVVDAAPGEHDDAVARGDALRAEAMGETVRVPVELGVGERVVVERVLDRDRVGLGAHMTLKAGVHERDLDPAARTQSILCKQSTVVLGQALDRVLVDARQPRGRGDRARWARKPDHVHTRGRRRDSEGHDEGKRRLGCPSASVGQREGESDDRKPRFHPVIAQPGIASRQERRARV